MWRRPDGAPSSRRGRRHSRPRRWCVSRAPVLVEQLKGGLDAPICLTWELTYACNLACVHCLSSSGRRDPDELTTDEAKALLDELHRTAGLLHQHRRRRADDPARLLRPGRPLDRPRHRREVLHQRRLHRPALGPPVDRPRLPRHPDQPRRQDAATNDAVRGIGSYAIVRRAMDHLAEAGFGPFKISIVVTRHNVDQLDGFKALADRTARSCGSPGSALRSWRHTWTDWTPPTSNSEIYRWLLAHGPRRPDRRLVLPPVRARRAPARPHLCGAGRVVRLIDPIGDVYACPFVIHDEFLAGNVRNRAVSPPHLARERAVPSLREPAESAGACARLRLLRRLPGWLHGGQALHRPPARGPHPECVGGAGLEGLTAVDPVAVPRPAVDHSKPVRLTRKPAVIAV